MKKSSKKASTQEPPSSPIQYEDVEGVPRLETSTSGSKKKYTKSRKDSNSTKEKAKGTKKTIKARSPSSTSDGDSDSEDNSSPQPEPCTSKKKKKSRSYKDSNATKEKVKGSKENFKARSPSSTSSDDSDDEENSSSQPEPSALEKKKKEMSIKLHKHSNVTKKTINARPPPSTSSEDSDNEESSSPQLESPISWKKKKSIKSYKNSNIRDVVKPREHKIPNKSKKNLEDLIEITAKLCINESECLRSDNLEATLESTKASTETAHVKTFPSRKERVLRKVKPLDSEAAKKTADQIGRLAAVIYKIFIEEDSDLVSDSFSQLTKKQTYKLENACRKAINNFFGAFAIGLAGYWYQKRKGFYGQSQEVWKTKNEPIQHDLQTPKELMTIGPHPSVVLKKGTIYCLLVPKESSRSSVLVKLGCSTEVPKRISNHSESKCAYPQNSHHIYPRSRQWRKTHTEDEEYQPPETPSDEDYEELGFPFLMELLFHTISQPQLKEVSCICGTKHRETFEFRHVDLKSSNRVKLYHKVIDCVIEPR
ncbi:hypothetical protein BGZ46_004375, partial [Entomortierella lignicola]